MPIFARIEEIEIGFSIHHHRHRVCAALCPHCPEVPHKSQRVRSMHIEYLPCILPSFLALKSFFILSEKSTRHNHVYGSRIHLNVNSCRVSIRQTDYNVKSKESRIKSNGYPCHNESTFQFQMKKRWYHALPPARKRQSKITYTSIAEGHTHHSQGIRRLGALPPHLPSTSFLSFSSHALF